MRFLTLSLLLHTLAAISIAALIDDTSGSFHFLRKRHVMSCEETYGVGSKQCGPSSSGYCYNPLQGQVCCETDFGYCDKGSYCAPVAGHCCIEGETVDECAIAGGFDLPVTTVAQPTRTPVSPWTGGPTSWLGNASIPHFQECTGASSGMAQPTGGGSGSGCLVLNGTGWFPFVESSAPWRWDRRLPAVSTALAATAAIFSSL